MLNIQRTDRVKIKLTMVGVFTLSDRRSTRDENVNLLC